MAYRIAGIDVHKKKLAVVVADVEVCLAAENYRSNRLGNDSISHLRAVANRLCRIPLNQPSLLPCLRRPHQHSKPIT